MTRPLQRFFRRMILWLFAPLRNRNTERCGNSVRVWKHLFRLEKRPSGEGLWKWAPSCSGSVSFSAVTAFISSTPGTPGAGSPHLLVLLLAGWLVVPALVIGVLALIDLWRISKARSGAATVSAICRRICFTGRSSSGARRYFCIVCAVVAVPELMDSAAKSQAEELVPAAEEYMKLQNANVAESGNIGFKAVGYKAPENG